MTNPGHVDSHEKLYQSKGAVISLQQLLVQRYAAKSIDYPPQKRSIAGISGLHLSKMRGRGVDFEEFRLYQPGDDIRTIDWRVTARTGKPYTKVFREERERPVLIALDQTSNMFFGSRIAFKSVIAAQAAAVFSWMAIDNGDRVGGIVFSDTEHSLVRPRRSRRSALHLLNLMQQYNERLVVSAKQRKENPESADRQQTLGDALGQIRRITKPGSTVYVISDFVTLDDKAVHYLYQLARHNNVICCFTYDSLEENLPIPGFYSITDGLRKGSLNSFDTRTRKTYQDFFNIRVEQIQTELDRLQIPLIKLKTNQLVVEQIRQWTTKIS